MVVRFCNEITCVGRELLKQYAEQMEHDGRIALIVTLAKSALALPGDELKQIMYEVGIGRGEWNIT